MVESVATAAVPERIGNYVLEARVGGGGNGEVFAARDERSGERVALKILARAQSEAQARRMEREARALAAAKHPHIVAVVDSGRAPDGRPYLVMPLLEGRSLREELSARKAPLSPAEAWEILRPIALALEAAHALGVVHRDVKPENVFLARDEGGVRPCLLDFGLAKLEDTPGGISREAGAKLTETGAPLGTPAYMPPEQWWGHSVGPAADQYALGVTAFEALAQRPPFVADGYLAVMQAHLNAPVPALASVGVAAPERVEAWLSRALAKDPSARFASLRAMREAGDEAFGFRIGNEANAISSRTRPWARVLVAALVPVAAVIAAGYGGSHDPRQWSLIAGWASLLAPPLFALALAWVYRRRDHGVRWPALLPGLSGTFGTYTGWLMVLRTVQRTEPGRRFMIFNEGMYEASANRFMGFMLSAAVLFAADAAAVDPRAGDARARWEARGAVLAFALIALIATVMGAISGALCAGAAAMAHAWALESPRARGEEIARGARRALAVAMVFAGAVTRVDGGASSLWAQGFSRARRAAEVTSAAAERGATLALGVAALAGTIAFAVMRARRAPNGAPSRGAGSRRAIAFAAFVLAWAALDATMVARVASQRAALWDSLAPQFALFSRLDPPAEPIELPAPHVAPALQIARDVVAIDGERVGLTDALASPEGRAALALDLSHRLARAGESEHDGAVQLSVAVDGRARWESVSRALGVAYGLGVRRAELLFTRGASVTLSAAAPEEAAYVLPTDFGARGVTLSDASGRAWNAVTEFRDVARDLAAGDPGETVEVRVVR